MFLGLPTTDWIVIGGFVLVVVNQIYLYDMLKDIRAEIMNIEDHIQGVSDPKDNDPPPTDRAREIIRRAREASPKLARLLDDRTNH